VRRDGPIDNRLRDLTADDPRRDLPLDGFGGWHGPWIPA